MIASPCVRKCSLVRDKCIGCGRTKAQIKYWRDFTDEQRECIMEELKAYDVVDNPQHYNTGGIECIDYIQQQLAENFYAYCYGNTIKYLHRYQYKDKPVEDLRKAKWYLEKLIQVEIANGT